MARGSTEEHHIEATRGGGNWGYSPANCIATSRSKVRDLGSPEDLQLVGCEVQSGGGASDTHQSVGQDSLHGVGISRSDSAGCVAAESRGGKVTRDDASHPR